MGRGQIMPTSLWSGFYSAPVFFSSYSELYIGKALLILGIILHHCILGWLCTKSISSIPFKKRSLPRTKDYHQGWLCIQHNQIWTFWRNRNCKQILLQKSHKRYFIFTLTRESSIEMWILGHKFLISTLFWAIYWKL